MMRDLQARLTQVSVKKAVGFIAVGIFNTLFNIALFDVLTFALRVNELLANAMSLVISVIISYFLNKFLVFQDDKNIKKAQLTNFFVGTLVIQFIVQHLAVWILGEKFTIFGQLAYALLTRLNLTVGESFVVLNSAKLIGVVASILISYLFYDRLVFKTRSTEA